MVRIDEPPLRKLKSQLQKEIDDLDLQLRPLAARLHELREQLAAVNRLLPGNGNRQTISAAIQPRVQSSEAAVSVRRKGSSGFTPQRAYWPHVLASLVELGGSAKNDEVIDRVGQMMEAILTPADRELLNSGVDVRWRNRVAWQRFNMVRQGLLRDDSPKGIWEINENGRKWLANLTLRLAKS